MTYRHAVKDADNNVPFGETLPVHYNALAGLTVEETESLQDYDAFPDMAHRAVYRVLSGSA